MRKPKTYAWLHPEMKKELKMISLEKCKPMIELLPTDIGLNREKKRKDDPFRINF